MTTLHFQCQCSRIKSEGSNIKDVIMKQVTNRTLAACLAVFISGAAAAEERATGAIKPLSSVKFSPDEDVKCLLSAIETGDPKTGRSTLILKASPGCVVPWHFHTAEEQLIIISGAVLAEMAEHRPTRLGPGGFAVMAGHMAHQFTCRGTSACLMIVAFDRAYDIFWGKGG
jgi:quercetin dioxygenase-like cupin family protein